jgi:hypothetical protein
MADFSHQQCLTFGYEGQLFNERSSMSDTLAYHLAPATRTPLSFPQEMELNARLMEMKAQALGRPIYLLQSGGLDSEVMIKSFKSAKVPFRTISFRFPKGLNEHEMQFVRSFSEAEALDSVYYDIDILSWAGSNEAREWFDLANCQGISMLPHMKLLHHIWFELGGMPVIGGGDVVVIKAPDGSWRFSKYEYMLSWYWFCQKMGIDAGVAFFQHTSEGVLAMCSEPEMLRAGMGEDRLANKILPDLRQVKYNVYYRLWPDLRRRIKFGGSELIYGHIGPRENLWKKQRHLQYDVVWSMPFGELLTQLSP